jgi:zinc protease
VMSQILSAGQSSRLYQHLVKDQELAQNAGAGTMQRRGPGMEMFQAMVRPGKDPATVEKAIYEEIAKIQTQPATDAEMEKVRMFARRSEVSGAQSTLGRAVELADTTVNFGDPALVNEVYKKTIAVTKEDVMRVAKKYLTENNRTVIVTMPKKAAQQ